MTMLAAATLLLAAVLAVALAACALLRRRAAAWRHAVLAAALLVGAVAPAFNGLVPRWHLPVAWETAAPVSVPMPVPDVLFPVPAVVHPPMEPMAPAPVVPPGVPLAVLLAIVWMAGAAVTVGGLALGALRLACVAHRCAPVVSGPWRDDADALAQRYGVSRPVTLLQSDNAALLVTWGFLRPRIVLPAGAGAWNGERRAVVLAHELAHIRRHDWALQIVAEIVRAVHWFNPLVWMVCRRLRHESEHACDDVVLAGGVAPTTYASHLLAVARHGAGARAWASAPAVASASTLERRVAAMLRPGRHRDPLTWRVGTLALTGALAVTVPLAALGPAPPAEVPVAPAGGVASRAALPPFGAEHVAETTPRQVELAEQVPEMIPRQVALAAPVNLPADPVAAVAPEETPSTNGRQPTAPRSGSPAPASAPPRVQPDGGVPVAPPAAPDLPRPLRVPVAALAQQRLAVVSGTVRDTTGGVMPAVRTVLTDTSFIVRYSTVTDHAGRFTIRSVPPGRYHLVVNSTDQEPSVWLRGFATVSEPLDLRAGAAADRPIMLPLRTLEDTLAVVCPAAPVATAGTALQPVAFVPGLDAAPRPLAAPGRRSQAQPSGAAGASAQAADRPLPVRVGGSFRFPERVTTSSPPCPRTGITVDEMILTAAAQIATDGSVHDVRLIAGDSGASADIVESTLTALRRWVYAQPLLNGQPVEVDLRLHITYHRVGGDSR